MIGLQGGGCPGQNVVMATVPKRALVEDELGGAIKTRPFDEKCERNIGLL